MTNNEIAALPHGTVLVLPVDLKNPKSDRRHTNDCRVAQEIPAGTQFVIVRWARGEGGEPTVELVPLRGWSHKSMRLRSNSTTMPAELGAALLPLLVVGERSYESIARSHHHDNDAASRAVVRMMLRNGTLTLDLIDALLTQHDATAFAKEVL